MNSDKARSRWARRRTRARRLQRRLKYGGVTVPELLLRDRHTYVAGGERYVVVLAASYEHQPAKATCPECGGPLSDQDNPTYPWTCETSGCGSEGTSFTADDPIGVDEDEPAVASPAQAARQALDMTRDLGSGDTRWVVYDTETGITHHIEQEDFEA